MADKKPLKSSKSSKSSSSSEKKSAVKSSPVVKSDVVKSSPVVKSVPVQAQRDPIMPVKQYLMSIGTQPNRIAPMASWAKGRGLSIATVSQWKTLFEKF